MVSSSRIICKTVWTCLFACLVVCLFQKARAQSDAIDKWRFKDLLDTYQAQRADCKVAFSVDVCAIQLVNRESPPIIRSEKRFMRCYFNRHLLRVDGMVEAETVSGVGEAYRSKIEHILKTEDNCYSWGGHNLGVRKFDLRQGMLPIMVYTSVVSPFEYAIGSVDLFDNQYSIVSSKSFAETLNFSDSDEALTCAAITTFRNTVFEARYKETGKELLPIRFRVYKLEKELREGSIDYASILKHGRLVSDVETDWVPLDKQGFSVPERIRIHGDRNGRFSEVELCFWGWDFEEGRVSARLDKDGFLKEDLASFDFDSLQREFENTHRAQFRGN